jgi:Holliday junction resolvase
MAYERESLIEKHLVAEVKKAGGVAFKFVSPGRRSVPDRIVLLPGGRLVFVECKAPGKPPRADQLREHERLARWALPWWCWIAKIWRGYCAKSPTTQ